MSDLPRMPEGEAASDPRGPDTLTRFHLTGEGAEQEPRGLRPALTATLLGPEHRWCSYPLVLFEGDDVPEASGSVVPLTALIAQALERMASQGEMARVLVDQIPRLARAIEGALNHGGAGSPLGEVFGIARERFVGEFDLSEAGAAALEEEIDKLEAALPKTGTVFVPGARTLLELYFSAVRRERREAETRFLDEARTLVLRLSELLQVDTSHGPDANSAGALSGELGHAGGSLMDMDALSRLMPERRGPTRLPAARRARVEQARAALLGYLKDAASAPQLVVLHSGEWPAGLNLPGVEAVETESGLADATPLFDEKAARMAEAFRALRIARLEIEGAYEEGRHDRALERFDWHSVSPAELLLFPRIMVLARAADVRRSGVAALSELLRSGRPVHALLLERPLPPPPDAGEAAGLEIGYVAAAHREALVLQSTLAQPEHLNAGFARMADSPRTALALVAVPSGESELPAPMELAVAHEARATPCFRFDPELGDTWAACLDLDANPQVSVAWPVHELRFLDEKGAESTRTEAFTLAHAAALEPIFGRHFRGVPRAQWNDSQIEIAEYLTLDETGRRHKLPFIWVVDDERRLARFVMTYEMAELCHERRKSWRVLRELAGITNEHADRAAEAARHEAENQAEASERELVAAHEEEVTRIREGSGQEALERLVNVLMDIEAAPDTVPSATTPATMSASPATDQAPAAEAEAVEAPEPEEEESVSFDEPYIDSVLCTTCNECTDLNSKLFHYNENKQAEITDASAGTFAQLVKAAEKCPARCIHPGKPRAGDQTATDALKERAAKFN